MQNNISTITTKYQVVIPKSIREVTPIKTGDKVLMQLLGDLIIVRPMVKQESWAQSLRGLGKDLWQDIDPVTYARKERNTWSK